ncbi:MAG: protein kinase [Acidobacteriota bacterium]|nr:MAG: protein kinase [Acidobacteriota bacterium]
MDSERWRRVNRLFHQTLELSPEERAGFLNQACADDLSLIEEVCDLLAAHERSGSFIDSPAYKAAYGMLAEDAVSLAIGEQLNSYKILSRIGAGGMGEVYLAEDTRLDRKIALKVLPSIFTHDARRLARFRTEARAAAALNHPNIATIYSIEENANEHFITMEYVDGKPLSDPVFRQAWDLSLFYHRFVPLADALAHAHDHGVIHRDIKPGNIMISSTGVPKLLDFGLARISQQGPDDGPTIDRQVSVETGMMGTPAYMSPEQSKGEPVGSETDIFSLGIICYEFLTGQHPFASESREALQQAINTKTPIAPSQIRVEIPATLESLILQMLDKDARRRPDAAEVHRGLTQLAEQRRQDAGTAKPAPAGLKKARRRSVLRAMILLSIVALLISGAAASYYFNDSPVLTDKDTILLADFENETGEAVFDDTLRRAVAVHLEQSPFLNLFPDERVRETLRTMNRSPDERVTYTVGREICQRQGLKALLAGSIAMLGRNYLINIEAINSQSGEVFAREQVEVKEKVDVLHNLGVAANRLRGKLGESLSSIEKFDVPLELVTTASLEALKAFTIGSDLNAKGKYTEAIVSLKRAVELDPDFARAWSVLSRACNNSGQLGQAAETAQKAFELRERVSEREKLHITAQYYSNVTGELHKEIGTLELLTQTWPNDVIARRNLGSRYNSLGQYDKAIVELKEAIRLNPDYGSPYRNLANAYMRLSRIDEARDWADQVVARGFDSINSRARLFDIAFLQGDTSTMQQQVDWASKRPGEYEHVLWQAVTEQYYGRLKKSLELRTRAYELALQQNRMETAGGILTGIAWIFSMKGECRQCLATLSRARSMPTRPLSYFAVAESYAMCGASARMKALIDELVLRFPKDTEFNEVVLLVIRAELELQRGNRAKAIDLLRAVIPIDNLSHFGSNYLRGRVWLADRDGEEAAKEFQKILDNPGWSPISHVIPLAHLGLARAAVLQGDFEKARKSYQEFFRLWKDADPDIPVLIEARKEYDKLK